MKPLRMKNATNQAHAQCAQRQTHTLHVSHVCMSAYTPRLSIKKRHGKHKSMSKSRSGSHSKSRRPAIRQHVGKRIQPLQLMKNEDKDEDED